MSTEYNQYEPRHAQTGYIKVVQNVAPNVPTAQIFFNTAQLGIGGYNAAGT